MITQILSMIQSFWLAALALSGRITVKEIILLSLFQGAINAFDMPARQAFVVQMVEDRADLSNAIALNSSMVNGARLIGPSLPASSSPSPGKATASGLTASAMSRSLSHCC